MKKKHRKRDRKRNGNKDENKDGNRDSKKDMQELFGKNEKRSFIYLLIFLLSVFIRVHPWFQSLSLCLRASVANFPCPGAKGLPGLPLLRARRVLLLGQRMMGSRFHMGMRRSVRASLRAAKCASYRAARRSRFRPGTRHTDTRSAPKNPLWP